MCSMHTHTSTCTHTQVHAHMHSAINYSLYGSFYSNMCNQEILGQNTMNYSPAMNQSDFLFQYTVTNTLFTLASSVHFGSILFRS